MVVVVVVGTCAGAEAEAGVGVVAGITVSSSSTTPVTSRVSRASATACGLGRGVRDHAAEQDHAVTEHVDLDPGCVQGLVPVNPRVDAGMDPHPRDVGTDHLEPFPDLGRHILRTATIPRPTLSSFSPICSATPAPARVPGVPPFIATMTPPRPPALALFLPPLSWNGNASFCLLSGYARRRNVRPGDRGGGARTAPAPAGGRDGLSASSASVNQRHQSFPYLGMASPQR